MWLKKKKKERNLWEGLSSFLYGPWESSSLCPWEKINLQTNGRGRRSRRRSLHAGRKITAHHEGRCPCQQVIQGQCPQRDPTTCSQLLLYQLYCFPVSQDRSGKVLCWSSAARLSGCCSMKQRSVCISFELFYYRKSFNIHQSCHRFMKPTY